MTVRHQHHGLEAQPYKIVVDHSINSCPPQQAILLIRCHQMKTEAPLSRMLDILFSVPSQGFGGITLRYQWEFFGAELGPELFYLDETLTPMPDVFIRDQLLYREFADLFRRYLTEDSSLYFSRKILDDGFLANKLEILVFPDRQIKMNWRFDRQMDGEKLGEISKYLKPEELEEAQCELAEYMEHKGRTRKMRGVQPEIKEEAPAPTPALQPKQLGIPDLFEEILVTALNAAPASWSKLVIDGQVWVETDASGRSLNNVSADFQAQMADGSVRQINPPQPIGAMNAFTRLQKELPNLEGKPWRHLRIAFDNDGAEQIAYWFDQGGTWRPEA